MKKGQLDVSAYEIGIVWADAFGKLQVSDCLDHISIAPFGYSVEFNVLYERSHTRLRHSN